MNRHALPFPPGSIVLPSYRTFASGLAVCLLVATAPLASQAQTVFPGTEWKQRSPAELKMDAALLDQLAEQTRAVSTYVRPEEDIEVKVANLHGKISHPVLADLRESGSIEAEADLVMMLFRQSYYERREAGEEGAVAPEGDVAELIIAKHRNGPTGLVKLLFLKRFACFENLAEGMEEP